MRTTIPKKPAHSPAVLRFVALSAVGLLLSAVLAPAKAPARALSGERPKPYALIFGTVWDPEGHTLYGVKVKIRPANDTKTRWELYSNHTGEFAQRVPAGKADYVVWADVKGYKLPSGKKLKLGPEVTAHIEGDERCDIGIHLDWE